MPIKLHRNSQKRIYVNGAIYFITTNTYNGYGYFNNSVLCDLFVEELLLCKEAKRFELFGYKINPQHIHLLLRPGREFNISKIMQAVKKNFAQDVNKLIGIYDEGENSNSRLHRIDLTKYYGKINNSIPKFKWQSSYHDHIIRGSRDLYNHLRYIRNQWIKHNLNENKYCFIDRGIINFVQDVGI
jgi:putative transposase